MITRTSSTARTTTGRRRTGILAGLLAVGLGAGVVAPAMASAASSAVTTDNTVVQSAAWYSSALIIDNHSTYTLIQKSESTRVEKSGPRTPDPDATARWESEDAAPVNGTTIAPNGSRHYELAIIHPWITTGTVTYAVTDADGASHGDLTATIRNDTGWFTTDADTSCTSNVPEIGCVAYNHDIVAFFDNR